MIALIQRVDEASVSVAGTCVGAIGRGLLALIGVEPADGDANVRRMTERLLGYRVFADAAGKMNSSVRDISGGLLLVPQFTLAADTKKGMRPSFSSAAAPEVATRLFDQLVGAVSAQYAPVACGRFGADMRVALVNNGPVTFWLQA
ncbi:MAG: D-tyrosyl-tRNA(Tyr) deacylase [Rhodocyclaceae bacterium]|nr:D-tyrosyl-tRNA(Tyr) deacylase [Rhodocyclaceae bacterium]